MAGNPKFIALLDEMRAMHDRKNQDYASAGNPYSNFESAGALGAMFSNPVDIAFAVLIGVKLARLAELRGKGKVPNNESIADTHLDLSVYASLWASYYKEGVPTPGWVTQPEAWESVLAEKQRAVGPAISRSPSPSPSGSY